MSVKIHTIKDIRNRLADQLSIIYPDLEIEALTGIILKTLFNADRLHLMTEDKVNITPEAISRLTDITNELRTGRPIQYILGETYFYDCRIAVNEGVLIPRQETEELVDIVIRENPGLSGRITDIGTGSGCIAIALAKNLNSAEVTGTDISADAIKTASFNSELNKVKVTFINADILNTGRLLKEKASVVVSNPPYIRDSEKKNMHMNVLKFEPPQALFVPDNDPLVFYRQILQSSGELLVNEGRIYFEINESMGPQITSLMADFGYKSITVIKDMNGKDRIAKGIFYDR